MLGTRAALARPSLVACIVLSGCGRIDFGALAGDAARDAVTDTTTDAMIDAMVPTFCAGCGPTGTASCCDVRPVPGGTFFRTFDVAADAMYPDNSNSATLSDFNLDTYEVTVGRFRAFVDAGMGTQQKPPAAGAGARMLNGSLQGGWDATWNANLPADTAALGTQLSCDTVAQTWTPAPGANEPLAIVCVSWYEAFAFCVWDGGFLPTEAQWNYAAAGGAEQRAYPWSNPPSATGIDCAHANFDINGATYCQPGPVGAVVRPGSTSPAGDGKWGHADLSGNVWEWTLDWSVAYANPCNDCAQLTPGGSRAFRGGSYFSTAASLRIAERNAVPPTSIYSDFGLRCAR